MAEPHELLRSGEVASAVGVNVQTLRYYERRGLLAEPERSPLGHRLYPPRTVTVIRLIKNAQRLGLSLDEIAELIASGPDSRTISSIAERKIVEIEAQLARLTSVRNSLGILTQRNRSWGR